LYLDGNLRSNHWQVKRSQWLRPRIVASANKTSDPVDLHVGLANEIVGGCEPAEVGHSLQVPDDDARFHWTEYNMRPRVLGSALRVA